MSAWHRRCSERSCASQEGPTCEATGRKSEWELKFETHHPQNASASIPFREIQKSPLQFKVQTSLCLPVFLFESEQGGGAQQLGKEKAGSILSSARVGFLPPLPTNLRIKANFFQARRQHSFTGRTAFKATGRHRSPPGAHRTASVLAAFCSNLKHVSASSLHSSGVNCN